MRFIDQWTQIAPRYWTRKRLKHIASLRSGESITSDSIKDEGMFPVFGGNGLRGYTSEYTHDGNFILIGRQGALCGNVNYAHERFWASEHAIVVSQQGEDDLTWLGELLRYLDLHRLSQSAAQPGISTEEVSNVLLAVPPLGEQRAISSYMRRETSRLDALVAAKQRVLGLLAEKRKAIISTAVTRGLDPKVRMAPTGVEWMPEAPSHWRPSRICRLFRQSKVLGFPDLTVLSVYREYGVIERSSRDDNANVLPDDLTKYQLVEAGDLVVNKMKAWQGSLGISELRGITSPDYVVFRPTHLELPAYLHFMLRTPQLTTVYLSNSNGIRINQWRIEPERFLNIPVLLPPKQEQRAIVAHIARETAKLDAVRAATERTVALLKERRSALIAAAVTGQLDVGTAA